MAAMRNAPWNGLLALLLAACGSTAEIPDGGTPGGDAGLLKSFEGHACSTDPTDDPQLVCTMDLICISTYAVQVTVDREKFDGGLRPVFVCRTPCSRTEDCPQPGDVCCPGPIHGKTAGKTSACVPSANCEALAADGGS